MNRAEGAAIAREAKARKQPPLEERFWSKVERLGPDECWPWHASIRNKKDGYGAFFFEGKHRQAAWVAVFLTTGTGRGRSDDHGNY
jgi:hypothetical protein